MAAVLTRPDAPVGRKKIVTPSPVAIVADEHKIPIFKANAVSKDLAEDLACTGAQIGVIVAYGALLKKHALEALPLGWLNLHYSLLPDWRGAAPVQNAILHGDRQTGVTLFQLDEGMDTGAVIDSVATEIQPGESSARLLSRLTQLGNSLLLQSLPAIAAGVVSPRPQSEGISRLAKKPTRFQAKIDWSKSASEIERLVLAFNPEPMAYADLESNPFRILEARALSLHDSTSTSPGSLVFEQDRVLVRCGGDTWLQLDVVQPAGKNVLKATDWARGASGKYSGFDAVSNER